MAQYDPIALKTAVPTVLGGDALRADREANAGLTTAGLAAGDAVQVSGALALQKADATLAYPVVGVYDGVSGSVVRSGAVAATFVGGLTLANGDPVYVSSTPGALTNVKPTGDVLHEVGVVVNAAASTILLQPKPLVVLPTIYGDTPLPQLTYASATLVNVAAEPSQPTTVQVTQQDGGRRTFSGTLTFNPAAGAVDGGLDTGVEGSSRWYYLYLVPSTVNATLLAVRGSVTDPRTGPTGYTNWSYVGAVRNDGSSNIIPFWHWRNRFDYQSYVQIALDASPTVGSLVATDLSAYAPATASHAAFHMIGSVAGNYGTVGFYVDGFTSAPHFWCKTGTTSGAYVHDDNYVPNYVPTPTIPKSVTHKLTSLGTGCAFTNFYRLINGWLDGYLCSWMKP